MQLAGCGKSLLGSALIAALLVVLNASSASAQVISKYVVDMHLRSDAVLGVRETMAIGSDLSSHPTINRIYPLNTNGNPIKLKIMRVTDANYASVPYSVTSDAKSLVLHLGEVHTSPEELSASNRKQRANRKVLHIVYEVKNAVQFPNSGPRLYFNVIGYQMPGPILKAEVNLAPPPSIEASVLRYQGLLGSEERSQPASSNTSDNAVHFNAGYLLPGQGLTIIVDFPPGSIAKPGILQNIYWYTSDWWPLAILPLLVLFLLMAIGLTCGPDQIKEEVSEFYWPSLKKISPAEMGILMDARCHPKEVLSTLLDLAVRGYVNIEEIRDDASNHNVLDYRLRRLNQALADETDNGLELSLYEKKFLDSLFHPKSKEQSIRFSELKNNFAVSVPELRTAIWTSVLQKGYFWALPEAVPRVYRTVALILIFLGTLLLVNPDWHLLGRTQPAWGIGALLAGALTWVFSSVMPAYTQTGNQFLSQIKFLQGLVRDGEPELEALVKDDPSLFGKFLPYAMVLGVAPQWATTCKDLVSESPNWYSGVQGSSFSCQDFVSNFGRVQIAIENGLN